MNTTRAIVTSVCLALASISAVHAADATHEVEVLDVAQTAYGITEFLYSPSVAPTMSECVANRKRYYDADVQVELRKIESMPKKSMQDERRKVLAESVASIPVLARADCAATGTMYLIYMNENSMMRTPDEVRTVVGNLTEAAHKQLSALLRAEQQVAITNGPWNRGAGFERFLVRNDAEQALAQVFSYGQTAREKHSFYAGWFIRWTFAFCFPDANSTEKPELVEAVRQLSCRAAKITGCDVNAAITLVSDTGQIRLPNCSQQGTKPVSVSQPVKTQRPTGETGVAAPSQEDQGNCERSAKNIDELLACQGKK